MNCSNVKEIAITALLSPFEGTGPMTSDGNFIAYKDPCTKNGLPITIAWGITYDETNSPIKLGDVWTKDRAIAMKHKILDSILKQIQLSLKDKFELLSDNQVAAILSFVYNLGIGNFNNSTMRKLLLAGKFQEASLEFLKWNKAGGKVVKGLSRRRQAEMELFLTRQDNPNYM